MPDIIGRSLGRYHVLAQIGQGGMATVYKACDTRLERDVALKIIRTELFGKAIIERILKRFEREAKALARLSHPNIVNVYDYGEYEDAPYLVLEYLLGGTLKRKLGEPMYWRQALELVLPIVDALDYAHEHKIIHRDIKPSNILLAEKGQPLLTDFGIAKILELDQGQTLTSTGMGVGTPEYMAPEQCMGEQVDGRVDIYALGVVLYELLTGRKPYIADTPMAVLYKHISDPLPRPSIYQPNLPGGVEKLLIKALAKKTTDRYQNMIDLQNAIRKLLETSPSRNKERISFAKSAPRVRPQPASIVDTQETRLTSVIPTTARPSGATLSKKSTYKQRRLKVIGGIIAGTALLVLGWFVGNGSSRVGDGVETVLNSSAPTLETSSTRERPADTMTMRYIPASEFEMGSNDGDGEADEKPLHTVYLDAFWMDESEITNSMYLKCVNDGACKPLDGNSYRSSSDANYPVVNISWNAARAYCTWVDSRLPSEAEWEKAARGGVDGQIYPWGKDTSCCHASVWQGLDGHMGASPVKSYPPNGYGLYDTSGNVWEWVNDWYSGSYYANSPENNPLGPLSGVERVLRGGSWFSNITSIRSANRNRSLPTSMSNVVGFRCASSQ